MSRSDYVYDDDYDNWNLIRWRGAVTSAIRGKRGQALLRELADALDAMPVRELIAEELEADGKYCALGVLGARRGLALSELDPEDDEGVADAFGVSGALVREVAWINDKYGAFSPSPEQRWRIVREWVDAQLR